MGHDQICCWLGLSPDNWPPNHYALLGLEPGESDPARIEHHVQERMERVRRYQICQPEQATEAMNRLAKAYDCLTNAAAKMAYDASLSLPAAAIAQLAGPHAPSTRSVDPANWVFEPVEPGQELASSPADGRVLLDWVTSPPPSRARAEAESGPVPLASADTADDTLAIPTTLTPLPAVQTQPAPTADPAVEAARLSAHARRGLGTKRALYYRIARTRQLLWAWERVGKYLKDPTHTLTRPADANDLTKQLRTIRELLRCFPPLLGEAGQPGCYVMSLARQQGIAATFQALLVSQRERLAEDWEGGNRLLNAHRQFLRDELRNMRRRGSLGAMLRSVRAALADNPGTVLFILALIALNLAYEPLYKQWLLEQLVVLLALAAFKVFLVWDSFQQAKPLRLARATPVPAPKRRPRPQRQAN